MKFNKILSIALMFPALATLFSCAENSADYTPAAPVSGPQVFFQGTVKTDVVVNATNTVFTIQLDRAVADSSASIALVAEKADTTDTTFVLVDLFDIPAEAVFETGKDTTTITCVAHVDMMEYDKPYSIKVSIANPEDRTPYGLSSVSLSITNPAPWKSLGMGKIVDHFFKDEYFDVEIQRNELNPSQYRVVAPYDEIIASTEYAETMNEGPSPYLEFKVLPAGSSLGSRTFPSEFVYFSPTRTGRYYNDGTYSGEVYIYHTAHFSANLCTDEQVCTFNKVNAYQEVNGQVIPGQVSLSPLYYIPNDGVNFSKSTTTTEGMVEILFPGFVKADYSAAVEFAGIFTSSDEKTFAVANLTLGADATEVKAVVVAQDADAAAILAALEAESLEVQAGRIEVPFNAEALAASKLQIVVAVYGDGAIKTVAKTSFEYYGGANPWTSLGTGYYTDDVVAPLYGAEALTYAVEILEHAETPGLYRVMNPYSNSVYPYAEDDCAADGLYLEVNATDAEGVYVQYQSLGFDWGNGEFAFETVGANLIPENGFDAVKGAGYLGKVIEGVIKFPTFTAQSGTKFQGYVYLNGELASYGGMNSKFEITLPSANAFARNMAKAKSQVSKKNISKKSISAVKAEKKFNKLFNRQVEIAE